MWWITCHALPNTHWAIAATMMTTATLSCRHPVLHRRQGVQPPGLRLRYVPHWKPTPAATAGLPTTSSLTRSAPYRPHVSVYCVRLRRAEPQCNDVYSAIQITVTLANALGVGANDPPLECCCTA
jgi:hypothetical protein